MRLSHASSPIALPCIAKEDGVLLNCGWGFFCFEMTAWLCGALPFQNSAKTHPPLHLTFELLLRPQWHPDFDLLDDGILSLPMTSSVTLAGPHVRFRSIAMCHSTRAGSLQPVASVTGSHKRLLSVVNNVFMAGLMHDAQENGFLASGWHPASKRFPRGSDIPLLDAFDCNLLN